MIGSDKQTVRANRGREETEISLGWGICSRSVVVSGLQVFGSLE